MREAVLHGKTRVVQQGDVPIGDVVGVLARCYFDSTLWEYVFEDEKTRLPLLDWVLQRIVHMHTFWEKDSSMYLYYDTQSPELVLVAALVLVGADGAAAASSTLAFVSQGLLMAPLTIGVTSTSRLLAVSNLMNTCRTEDTRDLKEGYWTIPLVATEPAFQHQGLTQALVKHIIREALATKSLPIYVNTFSEHTVRLFQRLDFDMVNVQTLPDTLVTCWGMLYTPP